MYFLSFLSVEVFVDLFEAFVGYVGVDLSGGNVGMTEHNLDASQIGAVFKKIGGEAVTDDVRSDFF